MGERRELPDGVVTFVFTDIEGSTRLFRDLGDRFPPLLDQHNDILRQVWATHDGAEVKTEGDAFFVAFADPAAAIRACVEGVERIDAHPWPEGGRIRIRAGMHSGVAYPRDNDYIAFPVNQAARIGGVGHGGQVVVSPGTKDLVGNLDGIHLHDLGSFRVRDFDEPIHLFQAEHHTTATTHPALRTEADVQHNVPADLPPLIGRQDDLAGVRDQMGQSRIVSVLGPGGVGKTRLVMQVATEAADHHRDGAWFVDLSSHDDLSTIRGAVADVMGCGSDEVEGHLAERQLLLVLDNCEQAVSAVAALVSGLLSSCAGVSFLVTSREPLAIASERLWRLEPFTGSSSAIELFTARAGAVAPGFDADAHLDTIAELCDRLDGLPLAIELAAARVSAMSPAEILDSLTDVLRVLRSRRRDLDPRQRTATGLADWSYQLLDDDEQVVLRRVGVFGSDFGLETATALAEDTGLDRIDVADIVWSLVEKSLVMPVAVTGGTRYRLLETTRAYAQHVLDELDERAMVEDRMGQWYRARFDPTEPHDGENASMLYDELANIRSLAARLATHNPGLGQWLTWILGVHFRRTEPARGIAELEHLVDELDVPGEAAVGMWAIVGQLHTDMGNPDGALAAIARGRTFATTADTRQIGEGWLANVEALAMIHAGNSAAGVRIAQAAIEHASELESMSLLNSTAVAATEVGDLATAASAFERVLATAQALRHATFEATAFGNLAEIEIRRGDFVSSAAHTRDGLRLCGELGMTSGVGFGLIGSARLLAEHDEWAEAVALHRAGERMLDETGLALIATDQEFSDQLIERAATTLGPDFETVSERGAALSTAEATSLAFELLDAYVSAARSA